MDSYLRSRKVRLLSALLTLAIVIGVIPIKKIKADSGSTTENDLQITYKTVSAWGNMTQSEVTVENKSNQVIDGWQLEFTYDDTTTVSSIWNAVAAPMDMASPNKIVVSNESYNSAIAPSSKVAFGMITQGKMNEIPDIHVVPKAEAAPEAEAESTLFPYAIYSNRSFSFQGWKSNIYGDVYTGSNFDYQGSELTLLGSVDAVGRINANGYQINIGQKNEKVTPVPMPDFSAAILGLSSRMNTVDAAAFNSASSIVANGFYSTNGSLTISGTKFSGDCVIVADGDITYNVDTLSGDGRVVLYSKNGNVTINGSQITINGIIYAPKGTVSINAYDTSFNGRIIANRFKYQGSIFNCTASASDLELLYDLPVIHITADPEQIYVGETSTYTVVSETIETPYVVKFRLNGEDIELNEDCTYVITPDTVGEYTLEGYVVLSTGEVVLDSATVTAIAAPTPTPTPTPEPTPTDTPTPTPTPEPTPTDTPTPTPTPEPTPTDTPEPTPTDTPTPTPTPEPTPTDTPTPTPTPEATPTDTPTPTPQGPQKYWSISQGDPAYGYKIPFQEEDWNYGNSAIFDPLNIEVCPDVGWTNGYAFFMTSRAFDEDLSFDARYTVRVTHGSSRADGIAFVLSPNVVNNNTTGQSIGYGRISPSLIIELDNYRNGGQHRNELGSGDWVGGESDSHFAVMLNGDSDTHYAYVEWPTLRDSGVTCDIWVSYDGQEKKLYVYIADYDENGVVEKPIAPTMVLPIDLEEHFAGVSELYMGFTSATAACQASHNLIGFELDPMPNMHSDPTPTPTPTGVPLTEQERYFVLSMGNDAYGYKEPYVKADWVSSYVSIDPALMNVARDETWVNAYAHYQPHRELGPDYDFCGRYTFSIAYGSSASNSSSLVFSPEYESEAEYTNTKKNLAIHIDVSQSSNHYWKDPYGRGEYQFGTEPYPAMISVCVNGDAFHDFCLAEYPLFLDKTKIHEIWYEYDGTDKMFYVYVSTYDDAGNVVKPDVPTLMCPIDMEELFEGSHDVYLSAYGDTAIFTTAAFLYHGIEFDPYPDIHERHNSSIEIIRPKTGAKVGVNSSFDVFGRINAESENVNIAVYDLNNVEVYSNTVPSSSTYKSFDEISTQGWAEGTYIVKVSIDDGSEKTILIEVEQNPILGLDVTTVILSASGMDIKGTVDCTKASTYELHYHVPEHDDWAFIGSGEGNKIDEILGNLPISEVPKDKIKIKLTVTLETGEVESVIRDFEYNLDPFINPTGNPTGDPTGNPTGNPTGAPHEFTDEELFVDIHHGENDVDQDGMEVTYITDIIGTVTGSLLNNYIFEVYPVDSDVAVCTKAGTDPVTKGAVGQLDPTLLMNGYYTVKLTAYAADGTGLYDEITVLVTGNAKIGNYTITFNDLTAGLNSFPIQIYRTYDSRQRNIVGDFGYGWELSIGSPKISFSGNLAEGWKQSYYQGLVNMPKYYWVETSLHEVTIDWGNGKKETFELKLDPAEQYMRLDMNISAYFKAKGGCTSTLEIVGEHTDLTYDGQALWHWDLRPFEPQDFLLTTKDGTKYYFNIHTGLYKIEDSVGKSIEITEDGISCSDGLGIEFVRDAEGRITSISDSIQTVSYKYDENGDLEVFKDRAGDETTFSYTEHFLEEITNAKGVKAARNEYDEFGRLIATKDADGNEIRFEHNLDAKREVITNRLGYSTIYEYDEYGNVVVVTDARGNKTYKSYDENNHLASYTDARGYTTLYDYSEDGVLQSATDPLERTIKNTYNDEGRLSKQEFCGQTMFVKDINEDGFLQSQTDAIGHTVNYQYDSEKLFVGYEDEYGVITQYDYDDDGNLKSTIGANGTVTSYSYDENNQLQSTSMEYHGNVIVTQYQYDIYGNLVDVSSSDGKSQSMTYDLAGNLTSCSDSDGNETTCEYNNLGKCTRIESSTGDVSSYEYDAEGQCKKAFNNGELVCEYEYDPVGNLKEKTLATGEVITYEYDENNNLLSEESSVSGKVSYTYDELNRVIEMKDAFGNTTQYDYDKMGNISLITDAYGNETSYTFDNNGNQTRVAYANGYYIDYTYDLRGRLVSKKDSTGKETSYTYDNCDNLVLLKEADNTEWSYEYDELGNLTKITDGRGNDLVYEYDDLGRHVKTITANNLESSISYNEDGLVDSYKDYAGNETNYVYDEQGRVSTVTDGEGTTSYTYDEKNQLTSVVDGNGTISYSYDEDGHLKSKTDERNQTVQYYYNQQGGLTKVEYQDKSIKYDYDISGRLKSVTDPDGNTTYYSYDKVGNLKETIYPNGITTTYEYNEVNALTKQVSKNSAGDILASYEYTLGEKGERLVVQELNRKVTYKYDSLDRLESETVESNGTKVVTSYTYDKNSNRATMTKDGVVTTYTYNELNQLVQAGTVVYTYDDAGNLVAQSDNGVLVASYEYNSRNKMTKAVVNTTNGTITETYTYNYLGDRTSKTSNGVTTYYLLDYSSDLSQNLVVEKGSASTFYTRGLDLVSGTAGSDTFFYLYDGGNSVRAIADENGNVTDEYLFDAFGNMITHTGDSNNVYGFQGEQQDETGLTYLRARYMDPSTGTFTSMDTYSGNGTEPVTLNKYLFANANPVTYKDPTGNGAEAGALPLPGGWSWGSSAAAGAGEATAEGAAGASDFTLAGMMLVCGMLTILASVDLMPLISVGLHACKMAMETAGSIVTIFGAAAILVESMTGVVAGAGVLPVSPTAAKLLAAAIQGVIAVAGIFATIDRIYSVYMLKERKGVLLNGKIVKWPQIRYVGRTKHLDYRMRQHAKTKRGIYLNTEEPIAISGLNYAECRFLEQALMVLCHTRHFKNFADPEVASKDFEGVANMVNAVSEKNMFKFMKAFGEMMGRHGPGRGGAPDGIAYADNLFDNEWLCNEENVHFFFR